MSEKEAWRSFLVPEPEDLKPRRHRRSIYNYGPEELGMRENVVVEGGPEQFVRSNPQLFATGTTSSHEGYAYWALLKIIGNEGEVGRNGLTWYYQSEVRGGTNRAGGAIVDFVVEGALPDRDIGIRIVTPFFHDKAGAFKRGEDFEQQFFLLDQDIFVVDVNSRDYINDPTGKAAISAMTKAIDARPGYNILFRHWGISS